MIVAGRREGDHPQTQVDDVEDYDYDNQADREAFCPDMDDHNDAYGRRCKGTPGYRFYILFQSALIIVS